MKNMSIKIQRAEHLSFKEQVRKTFQNILGGLQRKKNTENMNIKQPFTDDTGNNAFLIGAILFANVDNSTSLLEYALKAAIGATIWVSMKVTGDIISHKLRKK
jgi:hypothetical protein